MQAILKNKYHQFCSWLLTIRAKQASPDPVLDQLEHEMQVMYKNYLIKMDELRWIIHEYEEKQKEIRNRVKRNQKYKFSSVDI